MVAPCRFFFSAIFAHSDRPVSSTCTFMECRGKAELISVLHTVQFAHTMLFLQSLARALYNIHEACRGQTNAIHACHIDTFPTTWAVITINLGLTLIISC